MSKIQFSLNGKIVAANLKESILEVAKREGIKVPHLCCKKGLRADGNCRTCMVEIEGERTLAASCRRQPSEGMVVSTNNHRAVRAQTSVLSLLQSRTSDSQYTLNNELDDWSAQLDLSVSPISMSTLPIGSYSDTSHPAFVFNEDTCILCTRCVRACREIQANDIIGLAHRGDKTQITFDLHTPLAESRCVACGECVQACPTGALANKGDVDLQTADKTVDSLCPYCGVGCLLRYHVKDNRILKVDGRNGPANESRLCVKGRYGYDYVHSPERLTTPLIRREGVAKGLNDHFDPANPLKMFREASWDEALDLAASGFTTIKNARGSEALSGFGSAKGSNEEAYLFQKLIRVGFGTNNVDHCTRLCHASSVAALLEGIGSGAVSNQVEDVKHAEVILVIGSNTTANHPVSASFIKNEARRGKTLIVIDPRRIDLARHADYFLQFKPDTDVALLNALLHTVIDEDLIDPDYLSQYTTQFDQVKANVTDFSPEAMAPICGIPADKIREVARVYAQSRASMIFWGMGVSQHVHGTDNVRCLISLCLSTGQIGRPGTGLHPLRGQNNVQGASDAGLIPMFYPDYQSVTDSQTRQRFEHVWQSPLSDQKGLTVVEIMHAIHDNHIRGMYIMGENPAMSDPNLNETRAALAKLEHLVVQDIFLTETAAFADVVLPASALAEKDGSFTNTDRRVQRARAVLDPPGDAAQDLWIIQALAQRLGAPGFDLSLEETFEEMRSVMPSIAGISWQRLSDNDSVTYPCASEDDPGQGVVFTHGFPTASGKAKLVPAQLIYADEQPDDDYPFVLITGRRLEHWHTGAMTRRSAVLDSIEPVPVVDMHPDDVSRLQLVAGQQVTIESRRGKLVAHVRQARSTQPGEIFIPFCYHEAAANLLTNEALDPIGKIPEFKYCAAKIHSKNKVNNSHS